LDAGRAASAQICCGDALKKVATLHVTAALPWVEVPALMRELHMLVRQPKALQWTILTAVRAGETLGATRSEIKSASEFARIAKLPSNFVQGETWVVPAERMKEGQEHHVPLSQAAFVLISSRKGRLSLGHERQMTDLLNTLRPGYTVHGFRSTFADWSPEHDYPQELARWRLCIPSAIRLTKLIDAVRGSTKGPK
jgi:integrase